MRDNPRPLVSVIIPVYNGEKYLKECIQSVFEQTYKKIEVIIIDDNSHNKDYVNSIIKLFPSLEIKFIQLKKNQGVANAMNVGISNSNGEYVNWLSHDDLFHPLKLEKQLESIKHNSNCISYCSFIYFRDDHSRQRIIKPIIVDGSYKDFWLLFNDRLHGCSLLIPKKLFKNNLFNKKLIHTQDYDKWFDFSQNYEFLYLDRPLLFSRDHDNQNSKVFTYDSYQEKEVLYKKILIENFNHRNGKVDLKILLRLFFSMNYRGYHFINPILLKNKIDNFDLTSNKIKSIIMKGIVILFVPLVFLVCQLKKLTKILLRKTKIYL